MYRSKPIGNKLCAKKWQEKQDEKHKARIGSVKADIDNKAPKTMGLSHMTNRSKKEQQLEEKYTKIEHENRLLLQKMTYIMSRNTLDNKNNAQAHSLNAPKRRRELQKIMEENHRILGRIQQRRPFYDHRDWDEHAKAHDSYLRNICENPEALNGEGKAHSKSPPKHRKAPAKTESQKPDTFEKPILKEGRNIGDRYAIVTVYQFQEPAALSFRTYDLDTSEADRLDVTVADLEKLVGSPELCTPEHREDLAAFLLLHLKLNPKLALPKQIDPSVTISWMDNNLKALQKPLEGAKQVPGSTAEQKTESKTE